MGSMTFQAAKSAFLNHNDKNTNYSSAQAEELENEFDSLLIGFNQSGLSSIQYKKINEISWHVYAKNYYQAFSTLIGKPLEASWTEGTVTYNTQPAYLEKSSVCTVNSQAFDWVSGKWTGAVKQALDYGVKIWLGHSYRVTVATSRDTSHEPYLVVDYEDESPGREFVSASPTGGYVPKNKAKKFTWSTKQVGECFGDVSIAGSKFRYRVDANSPTTEIDVGGAQSYTLAAANITADTLQWQGETTDSLGNTVTTPWYTLSTVEALSSAVARSPMDTMVDGSADSVFRWEHIISTGTAPTASELQVSSDGSTWTALASVSGSDLFTTIPAGTLTSGSLLWRVRTYNTDNAAGNWSDAASILVIAAPDAPAVSVEQTPRPLISWQSSGQQGYQIRIPGVWESGSVYGVDTSRKCPAILPDGEYTVEVRVVNEYGMWSEWGSAPLTVSNTPGAAITLTASASAEIMLNWSTAGSYTRYLVERDGEPVAVTAETAWTDVRAAGEHTYRVYGLTDASDDYGVSDAVSVTLTVETNSITDLLTGQRLDLPYSTTQIQEEQITISRELELTHFAGAAYPSAELSESRDRALSFEAAFRDLGEGRRLEALVGSLVCFKAKNDESVTGVLAQLKKTSSAFWVDYEGEISQVDDREEVEL